MKIRIVGTPDEVTETAQLLDRVLFIRETSRPNPRRNSQLVAVYLDAELPLHTEAQPGRHNDCGCGHGEGCEG